MELVSSTANDDAGAERVLANRSHDQELVSGKEGKFVELGPLIGLHTDRRVSAAVESEKRGATNIDHPL